MSKEGDKFSLCQFDFVGFEGVEDYIGGFVVMAGDNVEFVVELDVQQDDYLLIMFKVILDCFVEVVVEWLYEQV